MALLTLTTDFGLRDPWVAVMKGVIASIAPDIHFVDVTHEISRHSVPEAAYVLDATYRHFPSGTIHLIVVDPGVGGDRRPLACAAAESVFVAPDNGILSPILKRHQARCVEISAARWTRNRGRSSPTFQGRDVFAPVAAWIATGIPLDELGPPIEDPMLLPDEPVSVSGEWRRGTVRWIDGFGNLITNIAVPLSQRVDSVRIGGHSLPVVAYYNDHDSRDEAALVNSDGLVEIFCSYASAAQRFSRAIGTPVEARLTTRDAVQE